MEKSMSEHVAIIPDRKPTKGIVGLNAPVRQAKRMLLSLAVLACSAGLPAQADENVTTLNFAVTRNGEQIGNTLVKLQRSGDQTIAETETNIGAKFPSIRVYRCDQRLGGLWVDGKLAALPAVTDDNGSVH